MWKVAEVIMLPGKPPHEKTSYRPISLLSIISELFEQLLLKNIKSVWLLRKHCNTDQVHRITNIIEKSFRRKESVFHSFPRCSTNF